MQSSSSPPLEDHPMEDVTNPPGSLVPVSNSSSGNQFVFPSGSTDPKASWSSLFDRKKESITSADMEFFSYPIIDGKKSMDIPYEVFDEDIRQCEDKVVGAFVGSRLNFNWVKSVVNRAWKPKAKPVQKIVQKWVPKKIVMNKDEEGWITKSKNGDKPHKEVTAALNNPSPIYIDIEPAVTAQPAFIAPQENASSNSLNNTQKALSGNNKENFQAVLKATQLKINEPDSSIAGSRAHFKKRYMISPQAINLFPKIADLKRSARDNDSTHSSGRIWVAWDPGVVQVSVLSSSPQDIFLDVSFSSMINFVVTFIYEDNYYITRNLLWDSITDFASFNHRPWVLLGDFNSLLVPSDKVGGASVLPHHYLGSGFKIMDLQFSGCFYTWSNFQQDGTMIRPKLDRVMVNVEWIQQFQISKAEFLLPEKDFMEVVKRGWNIVVRGNPMISLVTKMKNVKLEIIKWKNSRFKNMSKQVLQDKERMDSTQLLLQSHPLDHELARRERSYVAEYVKLAKYEESAAKQQSRIKWLDLVDSNTSFFHNSTKERRSRNNILNLYNNENVKLVDDLDIEKECINYYSDLFCSNLPEESSNTSLCNLSFNACIQRDDVGELIKLVTREEIVASLHSIGYSKAPGPDGFSSHFFKSCWPLVGYDLVVVVQNFFHKSKLLKEVNCTFITLIAKKKNPSCVSDYRPISCCNVTYKCITKIISLRVKKILGGLIIQNQSAFISGISKQDNIMVAHELVRNYHRSKGTPRCSLKIDLRKAYDTVKWDAIFYMPKNLGFPDTFIKWISMCSTTAKFSVLINGSPYGFFGEKRGLRQGCPISSYLFFQAMEMLSATLLKQKASLYYSAIDEPIKQHSVQILECSVGELPVKYFGPELKKSYNPIKWSFACHSYEEGGLGIKDLENTNVAAILRHIWDLVSGKETIWTSWVKSNLIKDKDFSTMKVPQDTSCFLHENWRSNGALINWIAPHILDTLGANDNSKVADFISPEGWNFPDYMEDDVQEIVKEISFTKFNLQETDQIFWKSGVTGKFSMKHTYMNAEETEDHLFHECIFSSAIWKGLLLKIGISKELESTWDEEIIWCVQALTGTSNVTLIKKLVLNNFVYHIWRERNNRIFRAQNGSQDQVSLLIIKDVRFKMLATPLKENDNLNARVFMRRWSIDYAFVLPEIIFCTWMYPQFDEVMINTNGSKTNSAGGFGAIIRDHEAGVIGAVSGEGPVISVFAHELQGVELGLTLALQKHCFHVHLGIDSMVVYNLLTCNDLEPPWTVLQIWRRILELNKKFARWRVTFCYKETNKDTDLLVGLYLRRPWAEIRHEEFTADFREILATDKAQQVYHRRKKKRS
ncbi:uncharacterized protein LOC113290791 [Papaver somniferum]|uniref:uncharacterized protein LOC113290791 n=1 Tax=Papaver somniferum TaxID=3469 RepID=UPI000E6FE890|nr:uncharacterized protein LOC113290791 [Papaver somniferum]